MAEFLGKPKPRLKDLSESFAIRPLTSQYYLDEKKARLHLVMDYDLASSFFRAIEKKFGKINIRTVEKAAYEAVKSWIEKNK